MKGGKHKGTICGGISMGVLGPDELDIKLDFDDVRFRGGCLGLGTAGMIVMNDKTDMVLALRNCVRFYAHESLRAMHAMPGGQRLDEKDSGPNRRRRRAGGGFGNADGAGKDAGDDAGHDDLRVG